MKHIWVRERVQRVHHVVAWHRIFYLRIAECNGPKNCWGTRCEIIKLPVKRQLWTRCPSFERLGIQSHHSPTSLLAAISSQCLAALLGKISAFKGQCYRSGVPVCRYQQSLSVTLPAKMSAFKNHMRQNAQYRNLKWTFEDLLPCYYYTIKTDSFCPCPTDVPASLDSRKLVGRLWRYHHQSWIKPNFVSNN